jgi:hypothetical protein
MGTKRERDRAKDAEIYVSVSLEFRNCSVWWEHAEKGSEGK